MSRPKFVFKQKIIKISEPQQKMLDEILATGSFAVEAEVFRQGITLIHKKFTTPDYLKPTPAAKVKEEKRQQEKVFNEIPDEEFVAQHLEDVKILTDLAQKKWVLFRKIGNYVGAVPLEKIKDWVKDKNPEYLWHITKASADNSPYDAELLEQPVRKVLVDQYGVDLVV